MGTGGRTRTGGGCRRAVALAVAVVLAGCTSAGAADIDPGTAAVTTPTTLTMPAVATSEAATTEPSTTDAAPTSTEPATTEPAATTTTERPTPSTIPTPIEGPMVTLVPPDAPPGTPPASIADPAFPALAGAFDHLIGGNAAVSVTVWRDHAPVFAKAAGPTIGGQPLTPESPMVLASVSKLITSLTVARLVESGAIVVDAPVPWDRMGIPHDPVWDTVTVRELLGHTSGMPKAQNSWLNDPGSCAIPLTAAVSFPPTGTRGRWTYSNGNYCALGLLIEAVSGTDRGAAAQTFVFDPISVTGPHLTTAGDQPADGPYAKGTARLERLGGAGTWMAGTDDLAAMMDSVTPDDFATMGFPATMSDQYGWGHTGTVDGAKACAWVMDGGRTVVVGIVSGNRPSTGGGVCDVLVTAVAVDLGIWADRPHRLPV